MNAREQILAKIKQNKAPENPLPEVPFFAQNFTENELILRFSEVLKSIGGNAQILDSPKGGTSNQPINDYIQQYFPEAKVIVSSQDLPIKNLKKITSESDKYELEKVDLAILKGEIGVAENGAIWLSESEMLHRALPFITQHLILILDKKNLVWNMHEAYAKISPVSYGVFVAGPSKTADIEQSLVIGAHGARSLTVFLV
jgi:L-lactate dehydrogenase complex protein LldG